MRSIVDKQNKLNYCGPAVAAGVIRALTGDASVTQEQLAHEIGIDTDLELYTTPGALISILEKRGLTVARRENTTTLEELQEHLKKGAYVIVCYTEPEGDGHYALLITADTQSVTLDDPWHNYDKPIPRPTFETVWKDDLYTKTNRLALIVTK